MGSTNWRLGLMILFAGLVGCEENDALCNKVATKVMDCGGDLADDFISKQDVYDECVDDLDDDDDDDDRREYQCIVDADNCAMALLCLD